MRYRLAALCLLASALVASQPQPSPAATTTSRASQLEQQKQALRDKIAASEAEAKDLQIQIKASDARRASLEGQISSYSADLAVAQSQAETADQNLGQAIAELNAVETSLGSDLQYQSEVRARLNARSRIAYKLGPASYLNLLLGSGSIRDFFARLNFFGKAVGQDRTQISEAQALAARLDANRADLNRRKADIAERERQIQKQQDRIWGLRKAVSDSRQKVLGEIAGGKQMLARVEADKALYLRQMAALEAESQSIAAMLRFRQAGEVFSQSGLNLAWPTSGPVVSPFGMRVHPIFGDVRLHTGIDIGAPYGQDVFSAQAGQVVIAADEPGYGTTVVIDHGNAFATLYGHLSQVSVKPGQKVGRDVRIGAVGCSGYCTGPHLHFETRIDGDPVDPMSLM